jgi:hypothetical protein
LSLPVTQKRGYESERGGRAGGPGSEGTIIAKVGFAKRVDDDMSHMSSMMMMMMMFCVDDVHVKIIMYDEMMCLRILYRQKL